MLVLRWDGLGGLGTKLVLRWYYVVNRTASGCIVFADFPCRPVVVFLLIVGPSIGAPGRLVAAGVRVRGVQNPSVSLHVTVTAPLISRVDMISRR